MNFGFKDKRGKHIKDGHTLRFKLEDKIEPSGYNEFERLVRVAQGGLMGFYSPEEKRVIPFRELYDNNIVDNAEVIH
ncbi:hypothetical protein [Aquimarina algiphila]|uniref:Uncharacterized protein n=1 Tax=Aquimarina algiphila TaxID=2047982 RepID=A0A554VAU6_9FLAO|nr:hypothetical protein [Aquimarina algiphila]TSE03350.1 hypothetical protein FOF46_29555 [Aquimarina algiphila]